MTKPSSSTLEEVAYAYPIDSSGLVHPVEPHPHNLLLEAPMTLWEFDRWGDHVRRARGCVAVRRRLPHTVQCVRWTITPASRMIEVLIRPIFSRHVKKYPTLLDGNEEEHRKQLVVDPRRHILRRPLRCDLPTRPACRGHPCDRALTCCWHVHGS